MSVTRVLLEQVLLLKEERLRRAKLPIRTYKPDSADGHNQLVIHKSRAKFKLIFGGNQSGKTITSAAEIAWWLLGTHPYRPEVNIKPRKVWVIGPEYRMIVEGIWRHLRPDGRDYNGMGFLPIDRIIKEGQKVQGHDLPSYIQVAHSTKDDFGRPKKSQISFLSGEGGEQARKRMQAAANDLVVIDEEIDDLLFTEIKMRCLSTDGEILNSCTLVKSEPYLLELEDRAEQGDPEVLLTRLNTDKNPHLSERAKTEAFKGMSDEELDIRKYGKSGRKHGLVFPEFSKVEQIDEFPPEFRDENNPRLPPKNAINIQVMDPGHRVWAILYISINPDTKDIYFYREIYQKHTHLEEIVNIIKQVEVEPIYSRVIDPKAFAHLESGQMSIGLQLGSLHSLYYVPAQNDISAGINAAHRLLPKTKIFKDLVNFKAEIRGYKMKEDNSSTRQDSRPDSAIKRKDHLMDCMRYGYMHLIGHLIPSTNHSNFQPGHKGDGTIPERLRGKIIDHPILGSEW